MDSPFDPGLLEAAGWLPEELDWEHRIEAAVSSFYDEGLPQDDRQDSAPFGEVLALARDLFAANDPRLATSLANYAAALRASGRSESGGPLFAEALLVWDRSGEWITALRPEHRARSALYHLRLKTRYPGGYDRFSRDRYLKIAAEGRRATLALRDGSAVEPSRLQRWRDEKPAGFNDLRKVLGAALLVL